MKVTPAQAVARAQKTLDLSIAKTTDLILASVKDKTPVVTGTALRGWHTKSVDNVVKQVLNFVRYIKVLEFGGPHRHEYAMVRRTVQDAARIAKQGIVSL